MAAVMRKMAVAALLTVTFLLTGAASCDDQYWGRGDDPCKVMHCGKYRDKK